MPGTNDPGSNWWRGQIDDLVRRVTAMESQWRNVPEPWHNVGAAGEPAFQNGWVNYDVDRPVRFYRSNGRCYLEGIAKSGPINTVLFNLPPGFRPTIGASLAGSSLAFPIVSNSAFAIIFVEPGGNIGLGGGSSVYADLCNVNFRCV